MLSFDVCSYLCIQLIDELVISKSYEGNLSPLSSDTVMLSSSPPLVTSPPSSISGSDASSIVSSASAMPKNARQTFSIPTKWRPSIMTCIGQETEDAKCQSLKPVIRNEIVRDLVTHMFSHNPNPQKEFCTQVAQMLVQQYKFMRDRGHKVSGYVSEEYVHVGV